MSYKSIKSQVERLCTILLTIVGFSATSRRGPPTSRRHFLSSLPHRDVKLTPLCHVATCIFTSRRQFVNPSVTSRRVFSRRDVNLHKPLSRRDVISHVATSFLHLSVTSRRGISTSRRGLNPLSVTPRRCLQRRDVT